MSEWNNMGNFFNKAETNLEEAYSSAHSVYEHASEEVSNVWHTIKWILILIFKIIFWALIVGIVVAILIKFNLVPESFLKFMQNIKNKNTVFKIIYYFIYALPCLLVDGIFGAFSIFKTIAGMSSSSSGLMFLAIVLIALLPCIIRYVYLRNPWGLRPLLKSTWKQKLDNSKKALESLENKIQQRRSKTPGVTWQESWIKDEPSAEDTNAMKEELVKLGYKNKIDREPMSKKFKLAFLDLCRYFIQPSIPIYPIIHLKQQLDETLQVPKPELETTVKYINSNLQNMRADLKKVPKMRFDYNNLVEGFEEYVATYKTKQLINNPIYTDHLTTNDDWNFENLKEGSKIYNYSYAISSWIFIHEQPPNRGPYYENFVSLINYGDKPNITYNMSKQTLRITISNNKESPGPSDRILFETKTLPMQTWNNIVINYDGGTLDIYINNRLVASEPNIIPYISDDKITVGQKYGLSGGICNVVYWPQVLSRTKIALFYETMKLSNPPVLPFCLF